MLAATSTTAPPPGPEPDRPRGAAGAVAHDVIATAAVTAAATVTSNRRNMPTPALMPRRLAGLVPRRRVLDKLIVK
jgi:hypothetical protein